MVEIQSDLKTLRPFCLSLKCFLFTQLLVSLPLPLYNLSVFLSLSPIVSFPRHLGLDVVQLPPLTLHLRPQRSPGKATDSDPNAAQAKQPTLTPTSTQPLRSNRPRPRRSLGDTTNPDPDAAQATQSTSTSTST